MKITKTFEYDVIKGFKFGSWPFGKPSMYSHIYFVDGLLLDTGHSNMKQAVLAHIQPLPVEQIFLTHHHEDHTGNLQALQAYFSCKSFASTRCVELMRKPPKISFAQKLTWGDRPPNFNITAYTNPYFDTEHYRFEIVSIPGHAEDMVCLYEANQGWLFSADLWVNHYIRFFMRPESMKQQINSMKRVVKLDFEVLLCSHNPQFSDGKKKLQRKIQFMEDFYGQVAQFYHQGLSTSAIVKAMNLKESWPIRIMSGGELSTLNMVKSVIRDENQV
ncbi:MAG: MBL fold metallo-hydrolase [Flammeovirgaceae bacterium]